MTPSKAGYKFHLSFDPDDKTHLRPKFIASKRIGSKARGGGAFLTRKAECMKTTKMEKRIEKERFFKWLGMDMVRDMLRMKSQLIHNKMTAEEAFGIAMSTVNKAMDEISRRF